jgi:hypothetical protein
VSQQAEYFPFEQAEADAVDDCFIVEFLNEILEVEADLFVLFGLLEVAC